jgi:hypothetical protein
MAVPRAEGAVGKDLPGGLDSPGEFAAPVKTDIPRLNCTHVEPPFVYPKKKTFTAEYAEEIQRVS